MGHPHDTRNSWLLLVNFIYISSPPSFFSPPKTTHLNLKDISVCIRGGRPDDGEQAQYLDNNLQLPNFSFAQSPTHTCSKSTRQAAIPISALSFHSFHCRTQPSSAPASYQLSVCTCIISPVRKAKPTAAIVHHRLIVCMLFYLSIVIKFTRKLS